MTFPSVLRRAVCAGAFLLGLGATHQAQATTFTVTNTNDTSGTCTASSCSLREAVAAANTNAGADTINFAPEVSGIIQPTKGQISITQDVTIQGPGSSKLTLDSRFSQRFFNISGGGSTTINDFTFVNGTGTISTADTNLTLARSVFGGNGTAVSFVNSSNASSPSALVLQNCTFANNFSNTGGAAISSQNAAGGVQATGCTFSNNNFSASQSTPFVGGGALLVSGGPATLTNCTFSGNRAGGSSGVMARGGAIYSSGNSPLTLTNCTITNNTAADSGGGIYSESAGINLSNSIVAGNTATTNANVAGTLATNDHNVIDVDPKLGPLGSNGGFTQTQVPLPGSPAIDAGNSSLSVDQRGFARPLNLPGVEDASDSNGSDVGAVEVNAESQAGPDFIVNTGGDDNDGVCSVTNCTLREAVASASADADASIITFAQNVTGTITLTGGQISVSSNVTIQGPFNPSLTVSGNNSSRIFNITGTGNVAISSLNLTAGYAIDNPGSLFSSPGDGGLIICSGSNLTLTSCVLSNGRANSGGAIACSSSGSVTLTSCTLDSNTSTFRGGAMDVSSSPVTAINCTFSNNRQALPTNAGGSPLGGGAIHNSSRAQAMALTNCTFSGNSASYEGNFIPRGGAILNTAPLTLTNCTITNNSAPYGGGVSTSASFNVSNTIIAGNTSTASDGSATANVAGTLTTNDHNIIGIDPKIGPLADNGGLTLTHALLAGSPARDAGNSSVTYDQRGYARPYGPASDIGSVEMRPTGPVITSVSITPTNPKTNDTLTANQTSSDGDIGTPTITYEWKKNGKVIPNETGATLDLSKAGNGDAGDFISVVVQAVSSNRLVTRESEAVRIGGVAPGFASLTPQDVTDKVGIKRTFNLAVVDADGASDIKEVWLLINERLSWNAGATLIYVPSAQSPTSGLLYLRKGDAFLAPIQVGEGASSSAVLDNGTVRVVASEVLITASGNVVRMSLPLTIRDGLVGNNRIFGRVVDRAGATDPASLAGDDGYIRFGTYTVTPQFSGGTNSAPILSRLTPGATSTTLSSGVAPAAQTFSFAVKDDNGSGDLESLWFLAGKARNWTGSATFIYQPRSRRLYLRSDDGNSFLGGGVIGTTGILENSQVRLDLSQVKTTIYPDGKTVGLSLPLQAKSGLLGQNKVWLRAQDNQGATAPNGDAQGYVLSGTWNVTQATAPNSANALSAGHS